MPQKEFIQHFSFSDGTSAEAGRLSYTLIVE